MATSLGQAILTLRGDERPLEGALDSAERSTRSRMQSMATLARTTGVIFTAVGGAITGVFAKALVAMSEQERVEAQLNATLKSTGHAAGLSADEIKKMASELQNTTTYGDEATISAASLLLTFTKIGKDVFPKALETTLDMSTAFGQDLKSSAIQLGKALQDPIMGVSALRRVGVQLNEQQVAMIETMVKAGDIAGAQGVILNELSTQVGGSAAAAADTLAGRWTQLKNALGDLLEEVALAITGGGGFKDLLVIVKDHVLAVIDWVKENQELVGTIGKVVVAAGGIALALGPVLIVLPGLIAGVVGFVGALSGVGPVAGIVAGAIAIGLAASFRFIMDVIAKARAWITANWDQIMRIFEAAKTVLTRVMQVVGKVLEVAFRLIGALFTGWAKGITSAWDTVAGNTKKNASSFLDVIEKVLAKVNETLPDILRRVERFNLFIQRHWKDIVAATQDFYKNMFVPLMELAKLITFLLAKSDMLFSNPAFNFLWQAMMSDGGGKGRGIGPHADGGVVRTPWQLVGERGPELARLPIGSRVYNARETAGMLGGGGPTNIQTTINFHQVEGDPRKIAEKVSVVLEERFQDRFARRGLRLGTA